MSASKGLLPILGPDPNAPRDVHLVGRYALGVEWQDGHSSIFPFDLLREACPCLACQESPVASVPPSEAQSWPVEIKKEGGGLRIRWQDDHVSAFGGRDLRERCRCASCTTGSR
jgi:DUF971 family protein